ncbi:MAG: TlyA family RNA methyltransferase [Oscillospiraceae bacterium]|nr:TlyA family RNA methyltransferase [Oscillospiraceae bacterium]
MKTRLDARLVEMGSATGRDRAKAMIMSGMVYVNGEKAVKAGEEVCETADVEVRGNGLRWVSRGGMKLEKALDVFPIKLSGKICMDIGASTGGFTDCMLNGGAAKVYAVDVGYGQLAWKLRCDGRVAVMERTNIRYVTPEMIGEALDFCGVDVSFISLKLVIPVMAALLKENGEAVCLIKPQFEAGRGKVGKNGVVRDASVHLEVSEKICEFARGSGFSVMGFGYSPIKGPRGNIEYLLYLKKTQSGDAVSPEEIAETVRKSHMEM